ncbi:trans-aconitate 2-methyltransferase [Rhizobium mongolense subsp. loessense]|uniref:Trans-aconitate 2-methyltransferase n=1 Tax=Rhizobium mongolense subsp. loessense TaxID=158890 RepID=A0A1G4R285_9HYPH|nr:trans-aconitate 2-methyltransferase [Rhizobium mongolense]SCW50767.1 trans-aconitate 2-methyltransferase [Rhizobium mongolense subsp. loessense]
MTGKWSPTQYLKFADQRTRPARDLLAAVPTVEVRRAVDLGCGPGNSTELLIHRWPEADVSGIDSSQEMIVSARERLPRPKFDVADIASWQSAPEYDLIFANAVLQWLPDHRALLPRLAEGLASGGTLAIQVPDNLMEPSHVGMRKAAEDSRWKTRLKDAAGERTEIMTPAEYYDALMPHFDHVDVWKTIYNHPLKGIDGIVEWFKSTGLKPFLARLVNEERDAFLDLYESIIAEHYPVQRDGTVLLAFPRLFIVAMKS